MPPRKELNRLCFNVGPSGSRVRRAGLSVGNLLYHRLGLRLRQVPTRKIARFCLPSRNNPPIHAADNRASPESSPNDARPGKLPALATPATTRRPSP